MVTGCKICISKGRSPVQRVLSHHLPPELGAEQGRLVQAASAPQIWLPTPGGGGSYLQHQDTSLTAKTSASAPAPHSQPPPPNPAIGSGGGSTARHCPVASGNTPKCVNSGRGSWGQTKNPSILIWQKPDLSLLLSPPPLPPCFSPTALTRGSSADLRGQERGKE